MLWIEKVGTRGGQLASVTTHPECIICRKLIGHDEICIGARKVHNLAIHFPFHPRKPLEESEKASYVFDENYFDDCEQDNEYIHVDCYPFQFTRPYACMFDSTLSNASYEEQKTVLQLISDWQLKYRQLAPTRKRKADDETDSNKKTKTSKTGSSRRRKKKSNGSSDSSGSSTAVVDKYSWMNSIDYNSMESPYLLGLSDDIWFEILSYLSHYSIVKLSESCKALYFYTNKNSLVWQNLATQTLCPNAKQVQLEYFPTLSDDFKKVFRLLYNNCCVVCGNYIRKGAEPDNRMSLYSSRGSIYVESNPLYYNFLIDQCNCSACSGSSLLKTFTKTNAKTEYKVSDTELGCTRCFAKPNPYSPSVAMGIYLDLQVKIFHLQKVEEELRKNYKKSKEHSKSDYLKIIEKAKRGDYGKDCKLYIVLNNSNKKIAKDKTLYAYIDGLSP